jgi:hypothetical protein
VAGGAHVPEVREAIAQLVRDYHPTEVRNFKVDRVSPDRAIITADVPSVIGQQVVTEVYIDDAPGGFLS